jgi:hypothetical protein
MFYQKIVLTTAVAAALALTTGCATTGGSRSKPLTTGQKIAGCVAQIALLEVIGRAAGANDGVGAAVGAATCAAWLYFENEKDKQRIAEAEARALETGQPQTVEWRGDDNQVRNVRVSFSDAPPSPQATTTGNYCRTMNTDVSVAGRAGSNSTVMCRVQAPDGTVRWVADSA